MLQIIKRYWPIIIIVGAILVLALSFSTPQTPPTPTSTLTHQNIRPGITQETELAQILGTPLKQIDQPNQKKLEFPSSYPNLPHQVVTKDAVVKLFIYIVPSSPNLKLTSYTSSLGTPEFTRFIPGYSQDYALHLFLSKGLAFLVHNDTQNINEIWYFQPTDLDSFTQLSPTPLLSSPPPLHTKP